MLLNCAHFTYCNEPFRHEIYAAPKQEYKRKYEGKKGKKGKKGGTP